MFRGGRGGGALGAELLELLGAIASMPLADLLRVAVGILLMIAIIILMLRTRPARPAPAPTPTACLLCGRALAGRVYVDRHLPSWAACGACYDALEPRRQRQYRGPLNDPAARGGPSGHRRPEAS